MNPTRPLLSGAPRTLAILDYGRFQVHADGRKIGICGYLISTEAGEHVLVDTGFPAKYAANLQAATQEDHLSDFGQVLQCGPENRPAAQLARLGLTPDQITLHIVTHTHIDHIGGLQDFPQAPILIADAERALPRPLYWGAVQPMTWPKARYLTIEDDTQIGPDFRILLVPGHAPGQLALQLHLPQTGPILLTSDAISRPSEPAQGYAGSWDPAQAAHSATRLLNLAQTTGALVIYGHCPTQWPSLKKAPDLYL